MHLTEDLSFLLRNMKPELNEGTYVFCTIAAAAIIEGNDYICLFKEKEGWTVVLEQGVADRLGLTYTFVAAWITLTVHSELSAVGLTAAFAGALADYDISCNVIAAFYHDHIFVAQKDAQTAMQVLLYLQHSK